MDEAKRVTSSDGTHDVIVDPHRGIVLIFEAERKPLAPPRWMWIVGSMYHTPAAGAAGDPARRADQPTVVWSAPMNLQHSMN